MGTTLAERIIETLEKADGPADRRSARSRPRGRASGALEVGHQAVNQTRRTLGCNGAHSPAAGRLQHREHPYRGGATRKPQPAESSGQLLAEDEVKTAVRDHLERQGYAVKVAGAMSRASPSTPSVRTATC